jgi:alpha-tubulin suppressor-like RCC1 family protein
MSCWGANDHAQLGFDGPLSVQPVPVALDNVSAGAAGRDHTCAVSDGTVWCWGANSTGQVVSEQVLPVTSPRQVLAGDAVAVAAGWYHTCAVTGAGRVLCWGATNQSAGGGVGATDHVGPVAIPGLPPIRAIDADSAHTTGLAADGAIWQWGTTNGVPASVDGLTADGVARGSAHACAVRGDGVAVCWGYNAEGQVGDGTSAWRNRPVEVIDSMGYPIGDVAELVAGDGYTCARTHAGAVLCWGAAIALGDGTPADRPFAAEVPLACPPVE